MQINILAFYSMEHLYAFCAVLEVPGICLTDLQCFASPVFCEVILAAVANFWQNTQDEYMAHHEEIRSTLRERISRQSCGLWDPPDNDTLV